MALAQDIRSIDAGLSGRIAALFAALSEGYQRRKVYRQTVRELRALSTRELADLGLHASMITRIAMEAAYGK